MAKRRAGSSVLGFRVEVRCEVQGVGLWGALILASGVKDIHLVVDSRVSRFASILGSWVSGEGAV